MKVRRRGGRRTPGAVVALSGLDGAGKSTQARTLAESLEALGYDAVVVWERITYNRSLYWITAPLRIALQLATRMRSAADVEASSVPPEHRATRALRERFPLVSATWVTFVALLHAVAVRRATVRATRCGRVVIRDRYVLDALVQLRDRYAGTHDVRLQAWLIRRLAPPPLVAYLLDVTAEEAFRRKPEEFTLGELEAHRQAYLQEAARLRVPVVDAERPRDELSEQIVRDVHEALRHRCVSGGQR